MRTGARVLLISVMMLAVVLLTITTDVTDSIRNIMFKGHFDSLFYSRTNQIGRNLERFFSHPLIGTGFNVPYNQELRSWAFSFEMVVENGNIILAILADTGIFGMILFILAYAKLYFAGRGMLSTIFFVPFAVSMGEMSFFSTNNFGIIMYFMLAIFLADGIKFRNGQFEGTKSIGEYYEQE
jgi:hypothetical protein